MQRTQPCSCCASAGVDANGSGCPAAAVGLPNLFAGVAEEAPASSAQAGLAASGAVPAGASGTRSLVPRGRGPGLAAEVRVPRMGSKLAAALPHALRPAYLRCLSKFDLALPQLRDKQYVIALSICTKELPPSCRLTWNQSHQTTAMCAVPSCRQGPGVPSSVSLL